MIVNKLSELMGRKRLKVADVVRMTGLARNTVADLYYGRSSQANFETLNKLCAALECNLEDILEYVPDNEQEPRE
ncbi:helix-turn-helix transcriptional regulator [Paenibacillus thiaminolyticus]|uniref:helix-turn-helix domain-containing protein n=1 Tax=Paenibacillus thiaminolyticus TaxID=49283 RepID=UPI003D27A09B